MKNRLIRLVLASVLTSALGLAMAAIPGLNDDPHGAFQADADPGYTALSQTAGHF